MSISYIEIDTAALNRTTSSMTYTLQQIRSEIEGMYTAVQEMDAMWDGPANQAFNEQFNIDHENMNALCKTVQSLITCMNNASKEYVSGDNQVYSIVNSIKI